MAIQLNTGTNGEIWINGLPYQTGRIIPNWRRRSTGYIKFVEAGTDANLVLDWTHYSGILQPDTTPFPDFATLVTFIAENFFTAGGTGGSGGTVTGGFPTAQDAYYLTVSVPSDGTFIAFPGRTCTVLDVRNDTGVNLAVRRSTDANKWVLYPGEVRMIPGITDAANVEIQLADGPGTGVVATAEALTY